MASPPTLIAVALIAAAGLAGCEASPPAPPPASSPSPAAPPRADTVLAEVQGWQITLRDLRRLAERRRAERLAPEALLRRALTDEVLARLCRREGWDAGVRAQLDRVLEQALLADEIPTFETLRLDDAALRRYWRTHREALGGKAFHEVRDIVEARATAAERKARYDRLIERLRRAGGEGTAQAVAAAEARRRRLEAKPETRDALREILAATAREKLEAPQSAPSPITEAEMRRWFEAHRARFEIADKHKLLHVVVTPDAPTRRAEAEAQARSLRARLVSESDAEQLAHALRAAGAQPESRWLTQAQLAQSAGESVATTAFALEAIGRFSQVIEGPRGFHIFRLDAQRPGRKRSFESARPAVRQEILAERRNEAAEAKIASLLSEAKAVFHETEIARLPKKLSPP